MNVNDLRDLIKTLHERIDVHKPKLKASEALTRYALIDPLLRGVGWDIDDPDQVRPEDSLEDGRADYVLFGDDLDTTEPSLIPGVRKKPVLLIEVKSLSEDLWKAALQALQYASSYKVRYFAVTDGQRWHVYDREKEGGLEKGRISCFDLRDERGVKAAAKDCKQAKQLWRRNWHVEFVHGWRVDADGKVRSPENGKENKNFRKLGPSGTRWILDGRFLNAAGLVLTPKGNPSLKFKHHCPPDTKNIVDGKFLDANGKEIRGKPIGPKGRRR